MKAKAIAKCCFMSFLYWFILVISGNTAKVAHFGDFHPMLQTKNLSMRQLLCIGMERCVFYVVVRIFFNLVSALLEIALILGIRSAVPPNGIAPDVGVLGVLVDGERLGLVVRQLKRCGQAPTARPVFRVVL